MRKRLYEIIEVAEDGDKASEIYDTIMLVIILLSLVPLAFKTTNKFFIIIGIVSTIVYIIDYLLRWITADYKLNRKAMSFVIYPFTPSAIFDLLAIMPAFGVLSGGFRIFKVFRLLRFLRVFRALKVFKAFRYSKSMVTVLNVIEREKYALSAVATLAVGYILISALIVFNIEPDTFDNYFRAVYWAAISLTTIGYGDISPVSYGGQLMTIISSLMGVALIALPSSIITTGYLEEMKKNKDDDVNGDISG